MRMILIILLMPLLVVGIMARADSQLVSRDHRSQIRGPWIWTLPKVLPELYREFNGIDFGHAHLAETLLLTNDPVKIENARNQVLDFIFSSPPVQPDEEQIAPTFSRLVWEVQKTFDWSHKLHRSLYDLFADDAIRDKESAYRKIVSEYLAKPEAITSHRLELHGRLWNFPESKSFRDKYPRFNIQIWAYHWLQGAIYDVLLMGNEANKRELTGKVIAHYHNYLRQPPLHWAFMPMLDEAAPKFARRFPDAANIFDNLHMLHDNIDDVLSRPDLFPTMEDKRTRILQLLEIYLHRNHRDSDKMAEYHDESEPPEHSGHMAHGQAPRPPSLEEVLGTSEGFSEPAHTH